MMQAQPATIEELALHLIRRYGGMLADNYQREAAREGLIYTRQGVLDMTRRHKLEEVVMDRHGQRIGGARAW